MALNERQKKSAELYAKGMNITQIANECGVSRQTIYDDQKNEEWKVEVDRVLTEVRASADRQIAGDIDKFVAKAKKLALGASSEKVQADMTQYLLNRICGSPSSKQADTASDSDKDKNTQTPQQLQDELAKFRLPVKRIQSE